MVFSGGVWQTEGGGKKTKGGGTKTEGGGTKTEGGGTKMGGRRRSHMLLEVQSDLVIHWLFKMSWQSDLKKTKIIQNIFSSHESNAQMSFSD